MINAKVIRFTQEKKELKNKENSYKIILNTFKPREKFRLEIDNVHVSSSESVPSEENIKFVEALEKQKSNLLILDLSEYQTRIPLYDFIAIVLLNLLKKGIKIVFYVSDLSLPQDSVGLESINEKLLREDLTLTFVSVSGEILYWGKSLPIKTISIPKAIEDQYQFREKLVSLGNIWYYGHYVIPSGTHIRKFIDLYPAVLDIDLYDFIKGQVIEIKNHYDFDLIIGFGLCTNAIEELGGALKATLDEVGYIFYDKKYEDSIFDLIKQGKKKVLLLSDVIYSGRTATEVANTLESEGAEIQGLFVILKAKNAPNNLILKNKNKIDIFYCTTLDLQVAKNEKDCFLCDIDYPFVKSETIEEYLKTPELPIKSYDFWEIVHKSGALELGHKVIHKGRNHYYCYINTLNCFEEFAEWIAFILYREIKKGFPANIPIHYVVCPNEEAAEKLGSILVNKLSRYIPSVTDCLMLIDRDDIEKAVPTQASDCTKKKYSKMSYKNVLIVDDGVSTLKTYKGLLNIITSLGANALGILCFLNRLSHHKMNTWANSQKVPFIYVYHYPLPPWSKDECPFD